MNYRHLPAAIFMGFVLSAVPLLSVDTPLSQIAFNVKADAQGAAVPDESPSTSDISVQGTAVPLKVTCMGVDCRKIGVLFAGQNIVVTSDATSASAQLTLKSTSGNNLSLLFNNKEILHRTVSQADQLNGAAATPLDASKVADLLQNPCDKILPGSTLPEAGYSVKDNLASILVGVNGRVIQAPKQNIDENDKVTVWVLADSRLKSILNVKRTSEIRTVGGFSIVGEGKSVSGLAQGATEFGTCEFIPFVVKDFAPGKGEVEIDITVGTSPVKAGSFDFVVDQLFRGMFSYGAISTNVVNSSFKLAPSNGGSGNVIIAGSAGDRDTLYAVFLTPFIWGRRDIEKDVPLVQHFNPVFGITTSSTSDHALAGVGFDWNGFLLVAGVHYARITELAKGYHENDSFGGMASDIPTTKRWKRGTFVGVTVDLRAAVALLRTVVAAPASGGK